jgi:glycosyltransferase involved in cell wall biosynthesis
MIEFIIPVYDREALLKCLLCSLIAQYDKEWKAHVMIDNPADKSIKHMVDNINDDRIYYTVMNKRYNDYGHSLRQIAKQESDAEYIVMTCDDNYYTPNFIKELKEVIKDKPGIIYWDMVHSHFNYQVLNCYPSINHIDMGAFATRTDLAKQINLNTSFAADGEFVEDFKRKFPDERIVKINKILFIHN